MRIILGIGNPEPRYQQNRHNVGFMLLDYFAQKHSLKFKPSKHDYYFCVGKIRGQSYNLVKPSTYVNNSGIAVKQILNKLKIENNQMLVVCDDVNLNLHEVRIRVSGGDGGHNGLGSIIYYLNDDNFPRLRIGIGNNFDKGNMAEHVLSDFTKDEKEKLIKTFDNILILLEEFLIGGTKYVLDANSKINKHQNLIN
ncbi:MAG: aminoacyl-tRNA hydrolase [Bacteroidetes bacterium]|nr:aminoacyl-tRNA hydrolase [Bacteroidota bacterium]